jgi:hypothetical protein
MPGIAARLLVKGALVVTKCPVAPVSRTAGVFAGRKHNLIQFEVVLVSLAWD